MPNENDDRDATRGRWTRLISFSAIKYAHPFLFAVAPIVHLYAHNYRQCDIRELARYLSAALVIAGLTGMLAWWITRSIAKAACLNTAFVIVFMNYGRVYDLFEKSTVRFLPQAAGHWILSVAAVASVAGAGFYLWRTNRNLAAACKFLTIFAALLVGISAWHIAGQASTIDVQMGNLLDPLGAYPKAAPLAEKTPDHPDVYYIILDGYARADNLLRLFGFDNSAFLNYLRSRGFYVADQSCSNYPYTFISLSSSLHMRYLDDLLDPANGPNIYRFSKFLRSPLVGRIFQSKGYRFIHFKTNFFPTSRSDIADISYGTGPDWLRDEFSQVLWRTTWLRLLEPSLANQHLQALARLEEIPKINGPTFTFAHLIIPHHPYVFDRNGNVVQYVSQSLTWDLQISKDKQAYIEQMMFLNKKMEGVIDKILAASSVPPIIIVQADHGTMFSHPDDDPPTPAELDRFGIERMPILNAYLVPEKMRDKLYPSISPVNSFRLLFNECFGEHFELLPDRNFVSSYIDANIWKMHEVTALVHEPDIARVARRLDETAPRQNRRRHIRATMIEDARQYGRRSNCCGGAMGTA